MILHRSRDDEEQHKFELEKLQHAYQIVPMKNEAGNLKSITIAAANRRGIRNQVLAVGAVILLSTACGLPIGFSAVLLPQLIGTNNTSHEIPIDINMGSWIASVHSLAAPCGSFISGPMSDSFGRRNCLIISAVPMIIGWCIISLAQSFHFLVLGRFICGLATGIFGGPAQVYIAETCIPKLRGLLTGMPYVFYSVGILIVYVLGASLYWRVVSWLSTILPIIAIIALCCVPESPSWLVRNNKMEKAFKALKILRGHETIAEEELKDMQKRLTDERAACKTKENIFQLCSQRVAYKPLLIVIILTQLQILTGTFLVIFYAADFIVEIGAEVNIKSAVIWTAVARTFCTFIFCGFLMVVRRRTIVTISGLGSGITGLVISGFLYGNAGKAMSSIEVHLVCACILLYIVFNTPLMIIPGVMIGELLPAKVRGRCAGFIFSAMNVLLFVLAKCFPYMQNALKLSGLFLFFTIANFACTLFMYLFQPETMCNTLDEIEDYFNGDNWLWSRRPKTYKQVKQADLPTEKP